MSEAALVTSKRHDVYPYISADDGLRNVAANRSVLVVGAGSGIGRAIAIAFTDSGATNIVISGRRQSKLEEVKEAIEKKHPKVNVVPITADATSVESVDALFKQIKDDAGIVLDVLVNSQGARSGRGRIAETDPDLWWADIESYLKSPFLTTRAFLRSLNRPAEPPKELNKAIVNITSIASNALMPLGSSYCIPKVGLNRLTEFTAAEGAPYGVQSVAIHPGGVANTDTTKDSPSFMLPYFTETAELAAAVTVYCSTSKAEYLNGRYVDVTWDLEELEKHKAKILKEEMLQTSILGATRPRLPDQMRKTVTG